MTNQNPMKTQHLIAFQIGAEISYFVLDCFAALAMTV